MRNGVLIFILVWCIMLMSAYYVNEQQMGVDEGCLANYCMIDKWRKK